MLEHSQFDRTGGNTVHEVQGILDLVCNTCCVLQEAPQPSAEVVVEVDGY
jgi:hypothetical protein